MDIDIFDREDIKLIILILIIPLLIFIGILSILTNINFFLLLAVPIGTILIFVLPSICYFWLEYIIRKLKYQNNKEN